MLDWREYAGKRVLVGQRGSVYEAAGFDSLEAKRVITKMLRRIEEVQ